MLRQRVSLNHDIDPQATRCAHRDRDHADLREISSVRSPNYVLGGLLVSAFLTFGIA